MHVSSSSDQVEALQSASRMHFVGIGGSGVRGLVPIFLARGVSVSGSDQAESPILDTFRNQGVRYAIGHDDSNVDPATDIVLISAAVTEDNPEVKAAVRNHIPVVKYSQCLGYLMREKHGIAVAGTHGKTTTTTMVSHVLLRAGLDPSFVIGGEYAELGVSSRAGSGKHFVAEACEFDRSFLNLAPRAAIVTNIEEEHLDYFGSLEEIQSAFGQFVGMLPRDGLLVYNADDARSSCLVAATSARTVRFSLQPGGGDWCAESILMGGEGSSFTLVGPGGRSAAVRLRVPGRHNIKNALASAAVASWAGVPVEEIARALGSFSGVRRRFDILVRDPVTVVDDYAHHPTEVEALVKAARDTYAGRRVVAVFQPHQYSRLKRLVGGFAEELAVLDEVIVTKVYRSRDRDEDVEAIGSDDLVREIRARGTPAWSCPEFSEAIERLDRSVEKGSVVLFVGAGSITKLAHHYASLVSERDREEQDLLYRVEARSA